MSKPTFYFHPFSGPCRTVSTVAKILNVEMEMKKLDLLTQEHLKPEFLKVNPFHKIPTFVDTDGFTIDESRVIAMYLLQSRKPDSFLYPNNDLKKRTQIDRWLHYDISFATIISTPMVSESFFIKMTINRMYLHSNSIVNSEENQFKIIKWNKVKKRSKHWMV